MWLLLRETVRQLEQRGQTGVDVSERSQRCGEGMSLQRSIAVNWYNGIECVGFKRISNMKSGTEGFRVL